MNAKVLPNTQKGNAPMVHYNLDRLAELRDRHTQTLENYRRAGAAVKEAAKSLARLRTTAASIAVTMASTTPPRTVQQIKSAETRLARLTAERDALKDGVAQSSAFSARLENFARERNL